MDAKRDWGYARDYIEGMYLMLQADTPDSFVLATNRTTTVRDFVKMAFSAVDIDIEFRGEGEDEVGVDSKNVKTLVKVNPKFYRPAEVDLLIGDYSRAEKILGWRPKTSLEELCSMMGRGRCKKGLDWDFSFLNRNSNYFGSQNSIYQEKHS